MDPMLGSGLFAHTHCERVPLPWQHLDPPLLPEPLTTTTRMGRVSARIRAERGFVIATKA